MCRQNIPVLGAALAWAQPRPCYCCGSLIKILLKYFLILALYLSDLRQFEEVNNIIFIWVKIIFLHFLNRWRLKSAQSLFMSLVGKISRIILFNKP